MKTWHELAALGAALALILLLALFQGLPEARLALALLVLGLSVIFLASIIVLGSLRVHALRHILPHSSTINGREFLILQMADHHLAFIDPTHLDEAVTILSPANTSAPCIKHGSEDASGQECAIETLVANLPAVERFSDEDFKRTYLS